MHYGKIEASHIVTAGHMVSCPIALSSSLQYRPIMLGEMATSGNFSALLLHQIAKAWKVKLNAQVSTALILSVMYIHIYSHARKKCIEHGM